MTLPTATAIDTLLDAIETAASRQYPPATLDIHGQPERRAMLRDVVVRWLAANQAESLR